METIYRHTRFLDTQNASFFSLRGGGGEIQQHRFLLCKAQHMDKDASSLPCAAKRRELPLTFNT